MIFICHYFGVKLLTWYFSAAFDTIDHSTLLSCLLDWFGVGGSALKWFSSYLAEWFQSVKIGSTLSDLQKLLFGVPQGSVLGPLLFSLYTSPLSTLIGKHKGVNFHFYADDSQLYVHLSHMNTSAAFDKLNRCLQDVKEWMSASKLKLNPDKTEFLLFGSKKQREMYVSQSTSWATPFTPPSQSRTWVCGLTLIFLSLNTSRMFVKAVIFN